MEAGARRERRDLADHVVDEGIGLFLTDAERAEADVDARVRGSRDPVARQLAVRGERGVHVPRHVDLRHDRDEALVRVRDQVRELFLRVVAARVSADRAFAAVRRQVRPGVDLDAPALVVGEMQVQAIELVVRNQVDVAFHILHAEEVTGHVEHRAAPREARDITDRKSGQTH